jgi:SAM-dependent methyltransferase
MCRAPAPWQARASFAIVYSSSHVVRVRSAACRATEHDAELPARCCDLVLLVDVYHELSDPPAVMAGVRRALTDRGRLVLVEYRGEDPAVAIKPEHKMTLPQIRAELAALGFHFVDSLEFLPDQRVVIFDTAGAAAGR